MKWFKHMADASSDEFIEMLEADYGLEGYARWWKILEAVAMQMDKSNKCSVNYSWNKWQTILKGKRNKLRTFLERLENESKIKLKEKGNILEIEVPMLLKIRDEYSKKSGHKKDTNPEGLLPKNKEAEAEEEVDINNGADAPADPKSLMWQLGTTLGLDRKIIGKGIKQTSEEKVMSVIAYMTNSKPADPVSYFMAATKSKTATQKIDDLPEVGE